MLKQHWFESFFDGCILFLYSEESEDVSIFGDDFMGLDWILVELAVVDEL